MQKYNHDYISTFRNLGTRLDSHCGHETVQELRNFSWVDSLNGLDLLGD